MGGVFVNANHPSYATSVFVDNRKARKIDILFIHVVFR